MHIVPTTVSQVFIKTDKKKKKMVSSNTSRYFNFNKGMCIVYCNLNFYV